MTGKGVRLVTYRAPLPKPPEKMGPGDVFLYALLVPQPCHLWIYA